MPKKYRLSRADFLRLPKTGVRMHGSCFALAVTPLPGGKGPKTACVVSKKMIAHAADRNRVQRRCREIVRSHISRIHQPLALVFYGKRSAATASFADTKKDVAALLTQARVLA